MLNDFKHIKIKKTDTIYEMLNVKVLSLNPSSIYFTPLLDVIVTGIVLGQKPHFIQKYSLEGTHFS